jgi:hypothetical protein
MTLTPGQNGTYEARADDDDARPDEREPLLPRQATAGNSDGGADDSESGVLVLILPALLIA